MKSKFLVLSLSLPLLALGACAKPSKNVEEPIDVANPASEYCVKLGGRSETKKDKDGGEYGVCHLPDGTIIDEWELFRRDHKQDK